MKILYSILLCSICNLLHAQIDFGTFGSDTFVEDAVRTGVFISRQSYQIYDKKTGELFGLNGKPEFGIQYTIGVKVPDGFCLVDKAVRPWIYDEKYKKYQTKYDPVFYQAKYSEIGENVRFDSLDYSTTQQKELINSTIYHFASKTFGGKGFTLDTQNGLKKGWLVWIVSPQKDDINADNSTSFYIEKKEIEVKGKQFLIATETPNITDNLIGGIYVVPVYPGVGIVEFQLCGILVQRSENKWELCCPFVGMQETDSADRGISNGKEPDNSSAELTPVKKTEKVKEQKKRKK